MLVAGGVLLWPGLALAQVPGFSITRQFTITINGDHYTLTGQVEMEQADQQFFADLVDYWSDTGRLEASGNVVYVSQTNRIAADRLEFNAKTRTGTFYNATGSAAVTDVKVNRSLFGGLEPDAYFFGETIEKLGPDKYKVTKGGFTTCVQPTPRWELTASTVVVTLDDYAFLKNPILKVKGVPLFYAPVLYYPIKKDDRATGFLIPVWGVSTVRGQSLSNAFFWAINRSHDATFFHDWFAITGQGYGGEYRYVTGPGSQGQFRTYFLDEKGAIYTDSLGTTRTTPPRESYQIRASAVQNLPGRLRARGQVDYFSDITVQQTYNGNVYDASRRTRTYSGNVTGAWGANNLSATFNVSEVFFGETDSTKYGATPRILFSRGARRMGRTPFYVAFGSEYVTLLRTSESGSVSIEQGLTRIDASPTVRVPFTKWPFLTVNNSVTWRNTYYTESLDSRGRQVDEPVFRQFFDLRSDVTGPVFTKVWDTPGNRYAEKFKHIIEPNVGFQRVTSIDNYNEIVKLESVDYQVGDVTKIVYGLTNRFLAKRREGGAAANAREFLNVNISQSYYTDVRASLFDPAFSSSFGGGAVPSAFSPILLAIRGNPTVRTSGTMRLEYDHVTNRFASIRANGLAAIRDWVSASGGWSRRVISPLRTDNFVNADATVRALQGKLGGNFSFNYDISRDTMLQRRFIGYYNAQCCGVAVEFQTYNFPYFDPRFPVPRDRRFNISFTLAGVGTFSNFFGALGGGTAQPR